MIFHRRDTETQRKNMQTELTEFEVESARCADRTPQRGVPTNFEHSDNSVFASRLCAFA
jgi:hypothetical protein